MSVSEQEYARLALASPDIQLELVCGEVREKPPMTAEHNEIVDLLYEQLVTQIDRGRFRIRTSTGRVRLVTGNHYVPDLFVSPRALVERMRETPGTFEVYNEPMPLVVEVWSPSTGRYDVEEKLREYQRRGDREIWRIHPYERTLTAWRRQPDGSYTETRYTGGVIRPVGLPSVAIDMDDLFE